MQTSIRSFVFYFVHVDNEKRTQFHSQRKVCLDWLLTSTIRHFSIIFRQRSNERHKVLKVITQPGKLLKNGSTLGKILEFCDF